MSAPKSGFGSAASGIATQGELLQRIKARARPQVARHLTIDGPQVTIVHRQVDAANENRIENLKTRLKGAHENLHSGYALGKVRDKAKSSFNRAR